MGDRSHLQHIDRQISKPDLTSHEKVVYIHPDQLNMGGWPSWVREQQPPLIFMESVPRETALPYHKKRLVYLLSSLRHFALECYEAGFPVLYDRTESKIDKTLTAFLEEHDDLELQFMKPSEWKSRNRIRNLKETFPDRISEIDNGFFLTDAEEWKENIEPGSRMEYFYRDMRRATGYLMDGDEPEGGNWNYDEENREPLPEDCEIPEINSFEPDKVTREVIELVDDKYGDHFGTIEHFDYAVSRDQALTLLNEFVDERLAYFGPYEDAMAEGESTIFHSRLSLYMNNGLLLPEEICEKAIAAYKANEAPINSVEGLVRQIIGWREYVRIYYETKMPDIRDANAMDFNGALPDLFWSGDTDMHCLEESLQPVLDNGYTHHIQRLMVLSNFSNLSDTDPRELNHWFRLAFVDAFEWVVLPNVLGMSTFADGGVLASKPYVSSGNYINKMSNYCGSCTYDPDKKTGDDACPFNYLYWNFVNRQRKFFEESGRNSFMVNMYEKKSEEEKKAIKDSSATFLEGLKRGSGQESAD